MITLCGMEQESAMFRKGEYSYDGVGNKPGAIAELRGHGMVHGGDGCPVV
jgi:hypothetical protein